MTAAIRFRYCAECAAAMAALLLCLAGPASAGHAELRAGPVVWYEDDARPIPVPAEYDPSLIASELVSTVSRPIARKLDPARWLAGNDGPAWNTNALDEVPNSTWFTNRHGLWPLTPDQLAAGPGLDGPSRDEPWEIIGAKQGGVTMGFRIRDAAGQVWLLKFDPPDHPGQSIRAGVVSNLILHACGYNTPVDRLVIFDRDQLRVGEGASLRAVRGEGADLQLTAANLDSVLQATNSVFDGHYHALASKFLDGIPLGPIRHQKKRADDPNDHVPHEHRREWRALRVFAAWIGHVDTKIQNTLAMYEGEPGQGHVVHYLIDFASTLGASGAQSIAKFNHEYGVDIPQSMGRLFTFGLRQDIWQTTPWPTHLDEVAYFHSHGFEPAAWVPIYPQAAFANLTDRDGYWAAKIISAFSDDDLRLLVSQGRYQDPRAVDWLVEHLAIRRDRIARTWFERATPLDFFVCDGDELVGRDLGIERGVYADEKPRYRRRYRAARADRGSNCAWSPWEEVTSLRLSLDGPRALGELDPAAASKDHAFLAVEWAAHRGDGWRGPVTVYLTRRDARVVALER